MSQVLIGGIDEAGRGPVIGPMVMAIAVLDEKAAGQLAELGVKDSKKMTLAKRERLYPVITKVAAEYATEHVSASKIDRMRKKMSLNQLEAEECGLLIMGLGSKVQKVIIDSTDPVAEKYRARIEDFMKLRGAKTIPPLVCEHKADDNHIQASAASVLAKVERDRAIEELKEEWGEFGSGYPADPLTKEFLKRLMSDGKLPDFVRKSWNTVVRNQQTGLSDF